MCHGAAVSKAHSYSDAEYCYLRYKAKSNGKNWNLCASKAAGWFQADGPREGYPLWVWLSANSGDTSWVLYCSIGYCVHGESPKICSRTLVSELAIWIWHQSISRLRTDSGSDTRLDGLPGNTPGTELTGLSLDLVFNSLTETPEWLLGSKSEFGARWDFMDLDFVGDARIWDLRISSCA